MEGGKIREDRRGVSLKPGCIWSSRLKWVIGRAWWLLPGAGRGEESGEIKGETGTGGREREKEGGGRRE